MSVWNGHYACTCYHPLFLFDRFQVLERSALRPGNVHSADGWHDVLDPVVARYRGKVSRLYFRADAAAFAMPGVRLPGSQADQLCDPAPRQPEFAGADRSSAQAPGRTSAEPCPPVSRELQLSGRKLGQATPGDRQSRVAPSENSSRASASSSPACRARLSGSSPSTISAARRSNGSGAGPGAIRWTRLSCRSFAANAVRLQLHALAYNLGNFLRTLATPEPIKDWSLTSLKEKLIKIGAKVETTAAMSPSRWPRSPCRGCCSQRSCG